MLNTNDFESLIIEIPIFGYELDADEANPIDLDEEGLLYFNQKKLGYVDISLKVNSGVYKFQDLPILASIYINTENDRIYQYCIEDPRQGFFMKMIVSADLCFIDLAADGGECQLCYNGLLAEGHSFYNAEFTREIEIIKLNTNIEHKTINLQKMIQKLKEAQRSSIFVYQREEFNESQRSITFTDYGIAHEAADVSSVNLAEDLPDDYWEPYSEIDIGIYRRTPTEAQIKSDLQYYNKDRIELGQGYSRNIKAYSIYAHSNPESNTAWYIRDYWVVIWWIFGYWEQEWIYPSEIEALWYHSTQGNVEIDVKPWDMIIQATVCYGYSGNSGTPHMAKAFVDNGATAFMGATVGIPFLHCDEFTGAFWYYLCQSDGTVYDATMDYISTHNYYDDYPTYPENLNIDWIYNAHIKIYGNINAVLGN